eukprot:gene9280-1554_t
MDVDKLLRQSRADADALQGRMDVQRAEEYLIDEGNLLAYDPRPFDAKRLCCGAGQADNALKEYSRENVQLLLNAIWKLPVETDADGRFAVLPKLKSKIPREKPVPKQKERTKWEQFAALKGIKKRKEGRMVFDEATKEYRPRWGYKRAGDMSSLPWVEIPDNADPYEDQFQKMKQDKKMRVKKNDEQRLKNIAVARIKSKGLPINRGRIQKELKKAISIGRQSTASAGVFDKDLPGEGKIKKEGKRSKRAPVVGDLQKEKSQALDILSKIAK